MPDLRLALCGALAGALLIAGCATPIHVSSQYDAKKDFRSVRTFAWAPEAEPSADAGRAVSPESSQRIRSEVESQLAGKGMQKAAPGAADLLVSFHGAVDSLSKTVHTHERTVSRISSIPAQEWVYNYHEGTLTITFTDRASMAPVWQGWAEAEVKQNSSRELIAEAVKKLLKDFPPAAHP